MERRLLCYVASALAGWLLAKPQRLAGGIAAKTVFILVLALLLLSGVGYAIYKNRDAAPSTEINPSSTDPPSTEIDAAPYAGCNRGCCERAYDDGGANPCREYTAPCKDNKDGKTFFKRFLDHGHDDGASCPSGASQGWVKPPDVYMPFDNTDHWD